MAFGKKTSKFRESIDRETISELIKDCKIPILTLDTRWITLFESERKNPEIKKRIKKLNNLLKEQGGTVNEVKDMKKLKKKLMNNIVDNMEPAATDEEDRIRDKKQMSNQKLIGDINEKLKVAEDRLMQLPYEIMKVNRELLVESMALCYERIYDQTQESRELEQWIAEVTVELKEKQRKKEEIDRQINQIYSFMHDIVGSSVIERFDYTLGRIE